MKTRFTLILTLFTLKLYAQLPVPAGGLVNWMTMQEAQEANKVAPRPMLIDFYTSWCGWCKRMMMTTYSSPEIAGYINQRFYPVRFDAETRDTIFYRDTMYVNRNTGPRPPHEFVLKMLGSRLSYPSTVFITYDYRHALSTAGYLDVQAIEPLLVYVVENAFRTSAYEDFKSDFIRTFRDSTSNKQAGTLMDLRQALTLQRSKPKKMLVSIGTSWCLSCRINQVSALMNEKYSTYMNDQFYVARLDAESPDSIFINGLSFGGLESEKFPFNPVVKYLTGGNFALPVTVFLDENLQRLDAIPFYITAEKLEPVLHYYAEEANKSSSWDAFYEKWKRKGLGNGE